MQKFYVLGHPIAHSYSPIMHNASFRAIGYEAVYDKLDVPPKELTSALRRLQSEGCVGVNLTVPLKEIAVPLMTELSPRARRLQAVNTVRITASGFYGDNTDADGLLDDLVGHYGFTLKGLSVAVIGCGGAGRAIAAALAEAGAELTLLNRSRDRLQAVAVELNPAKAFAIGEPGWDKALHQVSLIIQCTPAGIRSGDEAVLPAEHFHPGQFLYDIVIRPRSLTTPTLDAALAAGAKGCNGIGMLVGQGARAFTVWTGLQADRMAMEQAIRGTILA